MIGVENIFNLGMFLVFISFALQFRRTYLNRKELKDLVGNEKVLFDPTVQLLAADQYPGMEAEGMHAIKRKPHIGCDQNRLVHNPVFQIAGRGWLRIASQAAQLIFYSPEVELKS